MCPLPRLATLLLTFTALAPAQQPTLADHFPGPDIGARINAADKQLGSGCGVIAVALPATASTPVTLHSCHSLSLRAEVTWRTTITLAPNSSGQTITCPALQTLAFTPIGNWIHGENVSNVAIDSCAASGIAGPSLYRLASFIASRSLTLSRNNLTNAMLLETGSSATASTCDDQSQCQYPGTNPANSTSNVIVQGNTIRKTGFSGTAVNLTYVNTASVTHNTFSGLTSGVEWWGGDACIAGSKCSVGQNGAFANPRKTTHLIIADNTISAATSCIWGSMGQFIAVSANTCTGNDQGDVGIDAEGSFDVSFDHNTISNYPNGDLATFTLSTRIVFDQNTATQDVAGHPLVRLDNSSQTPDKLLVSFTNNTFTCLDPARTCGTLSGPLETIVFTGNHFRNTALQLTANNENTIVLRANDFTFTNPAASAISVSGFHHTPGVKSNGSVEISGNVIAAGAPQPAGAQAILVIGDDFNFPQETAIRNNRITGAFPIDIECDSATTNSPGQANACILTGNQLAAHNIVTRTHIPGAVHLTQSNNR
jgi:hypothetical protein